MRKLLGGLLGLSAVGAGGYWYSRRRRFRRRIRVETDYLIRRAQAEAPDPVTETDLEGLPEPVERYLRFAGLPSPDRIRLARIRHGGTFRTGVDADWASVRGEEYLAPRVPGFVWTGSVRPSPLVRFTARDRFLAGHGHVWVRLLSALTVADAGGPEVSQSAFLRMVSESPWVPTALVPGPYLSWEPIDERRARARIDHDEIEATWTVEVDERGAIVRTSTPDRYREEDGTTVNTPFTGYYRCYERIGGLRVPTEIEAEWNLPEGDFSYARFTIDRLDYDLFERF